MQFVLDELAELIRKNLSMVKAENVITGFTRYPILSDKLTTTSTSPLPLILIHDEGFVFDSDNLGISYGGAREETSEVFSCDGTSSEISLSRLPVRPIISVENPTGHKLLEYEDFTVNYKTGMLKFRIPPKKGKDNLIVRHLATNLTGETRGLRLKVKCLIDCFAKSVHECDSVILDVIKVVLLDTESLSYRGFNIQPRHSTRIEISDVNNLEEDGGIVGLKKVKDDGTDAEGSGSKKTRRKGKGSKSKTIEDLFGRRLVYDIETTVEVETKIPTIKEIGVRVKKPHS